MSCNWCYNKKEDHTCNKPEIVKSTYGDDALQIKLSMYQASNLANLLNLVMKEEPFDAAHNGEWTGEILNMIEYHKEFYKKYPPNDWDDNSEALNSARQWALTVAIMES